MAKIQYGVLKGTVTGHLRDADDDHYQILVSAGNNMFRIAVNVHSSLNPPDLLFQTLTSLPSPLTQGLTALAPGFKTLPSKPGGIAQDFVRGGIVKVDKFKVVPGDTPGADNDLKDTMETAVVAAVDQEGSLIYALGARFGPETKKDKYFKFTPGNGMHDIHMNQGNDRGHAKDDGIFQDGCLVFEYPNGKYRAFFMAFQSQSFQTDDKTGHALGGAAPAPPTKNVGRKQPQKKAPHKKTPRKRQH
jgi:uncharacterized protein YukJ